MSSTIDELLNDESAKFKIAALYKFVNITNVDELYQQIQEKTVLLSIQGGLILATEGEGHIHTYA
jgi:predicted sulfurtransferase